MLPDFVRAHGIVDAVTCWEFIVCDHHLDWKEETEVLTNNPFLWSFNFRDRIIQLYMLENPATRKRQSSGEKSLTYLFILNIWQVIWAKVRNEKLTYSRICPLQLFDNETNSQLKLLSRDIDGTRIMATSRDTFILRSSVSDMRLVACCNLQLIKSYFIYSKNVLCNGSGHVWRFPFPGAEWTSLKHKISQDWYPLLNILWFILECASDKNRPAPHTLHLESK